MLLEDVAVQTAARLYLDSGTHPNKRVASEDLEVSNFLILIASVPKSRVILNLFGVWLHQQWAQEDSSLQSSHEF